MPYPVDAASAAFRITNLALVPTPSEANVLFELVALAVDRPIAQYKAIAVACGAQVRNMQNRGHSRMEWRAALLDMLLGYYQWPPADVTGHYVVVVQGAHPPGPPLAPISPLLANGSPNPAYLLSLGCEQALIDQLLSTAPTSPLLVAPVVDTLGKKDIGITWLLAQTFFANLKVS